MTPALITTSAPRLGPLASSWDACTSNREPVSLFVRSWWLEATADDDAIFVLVHEGDELVGGLPISRTERRGIQRCELIGSGALWPHGVDVVARAGYEDRVAQEVFAYLAGLDRAGSLVVLTGTFPSSSLVRNAPPRARTEQIGEWFTVTLPTNYEAYLAARPRHLRQEIRRIERRLTERGITYTTLTGPDPVDRAIKEFERLHRLRWNEQSGFLPAIAAFSRAARAGAERGEIVFHEVACGERVLATLVTFEVGTSCLFYQMGRDPDPEWSGTGLYLRARAIRRSCEVGHRVVDLGTGSPEAKLAWIDERHHLVRLTWGARLGRAVFAWRGIKHPVASTLKRPRPDA